MNGFFIALVIHFVSFVLLCTSVDGHYLMCPRGFTGSLPHPNDCTMFLYCAYGRPELRRCWSGRVFNPQTQTCDPSENISNCHYGNLQIPTEKVYGGGRNHKEKSHKRQVQSGRPHDARGHNEVGESIINEVFDLGNAGQVPNKVGYPKVVNSEGELTENEIDVANVGQGPNGVGHGIVNTGQVHGGAEYGKKACTGGVQTGSGFDSQGNNGMLNSGQGHSGQVHTNGGNTGHRVVNVGVASPERNYDGIGLIDIR